MSDQRPREPYEPPANEPPRSPPPPLAAPLSASDDKLWASLAHFGGVFWILPSLIIYLVFKDRGTRTRVEAKEALNWQITFLIGFIILSIICGIVNGILFNIGAWGLTVLFTWLPLVLCILNVVFSLIGGVTVSSGGSYRYPLAQRFIK
jgi:uncharacterized Tic20 family protein